MVNKEIVLVYDNRVLLSTIFADNEFVINENYSKREKVTNGNYYREIKIRDKKMGFEFFPIIDFVGRETGGYIGVGFYLSDLENLYSASIKRFIVFFIVFSILVIIILNVGLKYLFKPLDKVIKITQNISIGEYEIVRSNSDRKEIAMITDSMDAMAKSIEHRERELKYATQQLKEMNQNLEKTVESRTIELSDALERLRKTQEEMIIKEKLMSVGKLAGGIAHELNSPLGAILTSVQLIKQSMLTIKQNDLQCDICDSVEIIEEATLKSKGIIDKLLKRDSIYLETRISEIDVKRIILDTVVVSEFKYRFEEHNIGFSLNLEDNIRILANDILIMLVLLNIIENAAEAIIRKKNKTKGLISIYSYIVDENVYIEIEDNGSGMDVESKKKVFDPFYTTKDVGALGLGMTTVYEIIRSHNGHISIESELEQGTKVILKFFII